MSTQIQVKNPKTMAFILMLGAFAGLFGETALNMALSNIMEQFEVAATTAQWLTTGYLLVLAILVPVSALLMKWFTTRQLVIGGLVISLLGAILAALNFSFGILLLGRVVQAIGTGLLLPVMLSVMLLIFPIQKRGVVMGLMGLVITLAPALGPTLSGVIISTLSWPYIFWFSAIAYVLLILVAVVKIENVSEITKPKIDVSSILLSTIGFGGLIFALSTMAEVAISSPKVWVPFLVGIIALVSFGIRQNHMAQPMVNLRVFKYPMFTLGTLTMFLGILIILSTGILLPMYLKGALLFSAAMAGFLLLPGNAVNFILSPIVGALFDKVGARRFTIIGFIFVLIGNIVFLTTISSQTPAWQVVVAFMILFFGLTMVMMPAQTNAMNQLPHELYADGSAAMNTLNQVAGAAGTAIAITVFTSGQNSYVMDFPNASQPEILAAGIKYAFYFITGISIVGLIGSFFVKKPSAVTEKSPVAVITTETVNSLPISKKSDAILEQLH
ncbi:DHA2 family efflux MFS transporter permease subunit [Bacillus sp. EB106-08-02-XG196]|uniref:DHA2 family efflux MFS transporter permease subunit n=1 Tax=Bacillus sp. EB106-08-02-XG196 TaxID=2737049 RepID=UPI0015C4855F|nr:DHA2 family efflux MFS transporter permease subunit [Bacillus sp. EB106-08-02-XG196]NWQ41439.1 DHA2 family efflux MFS transporter permease subunit [Bacillus sp. EB106-08-02-XG196]